MHSVRNAYTYTFTTTRHWKTAWSLQHYSIGGNDLRQHLLRAALHYTSEARHNSEQPFCPEQHAHSAQLANRQPHSHCALSKCEASYYLACALSLTEKQDGLPRYTANQKKSQHASSHTNHTTAPTPNRRVGKRYHRAQGIHVSDHSSGVATLLLCIRQQPMLTTISGPY